MFSRPIPRRAMWGALVGFVYAVLLVFIPDVRMKLAAVGWAVLAIALLFARPFAYYTYIAWALVWMAWKAVQAFQGEGGPVAAAALDVLVPLASIALLSSSGYLEAVRPPPRELA